MIIRRHQIFFGEGPRDENEKVLGLGKWAFIRCGGAENR